MKRTILAIRQFPVYFSRLQSLSQHHGVDFSVKRASCSLPITSTSGALRKPTPEENHQAFSWMGGGRRKHGRKQQLKAPVCSLAEAHAAITVEAPSPV